MTVVSEETTLQQLEFQLAKRGIQIVTIAFSGSSYEAKYCTKTTPRARLRCYGATLMETFSNVIASHDLCVKSGCPVGSTHGP